MNFRFVFSSLLIWKQFRKCINVIILTCKKSSILNLMVFPKSNFRLQAGAMRIGTDNVDMLGCFKKHRIADVRDEKPFRVLNLLLSVHFSISDRHIFIPTLNLISQNFQNNLLFYLIILLNVENIFYRLYSLLSRTFYKEIQSF